MMSPVNELRSSDLIDVNPSRPLYQPYEITLPQVNISFIILQHKVISLKPVNTILRWI
jgi:hypothetical protein